MTVVVFGSINIDLVVKTHRFPVPGETITGKGFFTASGGKGANQAVASSKIGAKTWMVGRVGNDVFGDSLIKSLQLAGVLIDGVVKDEEAPSGTALITVDDTGENEIIINAGANEQLAEEDLARLVDKLSTKTILLLQLEIPIDMNIKAAKVARSQGACVILDPAPASIIPDELYRHVDWITPNEHEAAQLVGFEILDRDSAHKAAMVFHQKGVAHVVVKMGSKGAFWSNGEEGFLLPPFSVYARDTVAAGDAFNGVLAAGLDQGLPEYQALRRACAAGALSTTHEGAQQSMPTLSELEEFIGEYD